MFTMWHTLYIAYPCISRCSIRRPFEIAKEVAIPVHSSHAVDENSGTTSATPGANRPPEQRRIRPVMGPGNLYAGRQRRSARGPVGDAAGPGARTVDVSGDC